MAFSFMVIWMIDGLLGAYQKITNKFDTGEKNEYNR
jgi:hypothetical protein